MSKNLYVCPVGKQGKDFLAKVIQKFGYKDFDYLILVYDETKFEEEIYQGVNFVYAMGQKWALLKKYATPAYCRHYDYIFLWDDDIDVEDFSYQNFIKIMQKNNLENAQPALTPYSYFSHKITLQNKEYTIGRYTDFVEIMVPVFTREAWIKYWYMVEKDCNFLGWGYDDLSKSICDYSNIGIIDCEIITHTKALRTTSPYTLVEKKRFKEKYKNYKQVEQIVYGKLK